MLPYFQQGSSGMGSFDPFIYAPVRLIRSGFTPFLQTVASQPLLLPIAAVPQSWVGLRSSSCFISNALMALWPYLMSMV